MVDNLTPAERSKRMRRIEAKNTKPELMVRSLVHKLGYRYVIHDRRLPGSPDMVFPARRKVIFVHGCFWHRHSRCRLARLPKSNLDFWFTKLEANRLRDRRQLAALRNLGWRPLVVWECQLADPGRLAARLTAFLEEKS